ncbi:hypothetical protein BRCON_1903 [Candidatus Sumerlaea chitinivorans]|uniref:Uncharacterized protein n=1 Tax=Sumerlaea chitinivorans TaxID=2250252 RepID=A0A2Z4Y656_SUMC1|nr:hypothetical protein BRCON_1903 [Candidatus Sumerlaea chitinivorans]
MKKCRRRGGHKQENILFIAVISPTSLLDRRRSGASVGFLASGNRVEFRLRNSRAVGHTS